MNSYVLKDKIHLEISILNDSTINENWKLFKGIRWNG